jgi:hypothetical protein
MGIVSDQIRQEPIDGASGVDRRAGVKGPRTRVLVQSLVMVSCVLPILSIGAEQLLALGAVAPLALLAAVAASLVFGDRMMLGNPEADADRSPS